MKKLVTILFVGIITSLANAQWNPNTDQNLLVANPITGSAFSGITNDGKTYIAYWKKVDAPTNYELWVQLLDQNGNKLFGSNGIMLSNQIPMATYTISERTAVDSSGNFYIGVTGSGAGNPAYIFKITPQGTSVWPNGISITSGYLPVVLPLSNGDIAVSYTPANTGKMLVQRFSTAGQPVWANPVEILSNDPSKITMPADLFQLANGEIETVFHKRVSSSTTSYLFAQKLDLNGNIMWADGAIQIAQKTTSYNTRYKGVVDGNVLYYGYTTGEGNRFDSYLQRVNDDSSLPWGANGQDFDTNQTSFEKNMKIAFTPGSQFIWAVANYTPSAQGSGGEYVQKFDKNTGARLFTDNAKEVFAISTEFRIHTGDLHLVDDKPYFVIEKRINPAMLPTSLNAVLLDANGNFAWTQQFIPLATFNAEKTYVNVLNPVNGNGVIVFNEKKTGDANAMVYAQSFALPAAGLGVFDLKNTASIRLFPNPATDFINLEGLKDSEFTIYNMVGQRVQSGKTVAAQINIHHLTKGKYLLKLKDYNQAFTFIKK